jgi:hypothetical protein
MLLLKNQESGSVSSLIPQTFLKLKFQNSSISGISMAMTSQVTSETKENVARATLSQ